MGRADAAADLFFRTTSPQASLPHTVTYGGVSAGIAGPPHDRMLEVMGNSSWSLAMLLDEPQLAVFTSEALVEAVDAGVAMGLFRVDGGSVIDPIPPAETVAAEAQKLEAWLKSGQSDVMLPGEPERRARIKRATSIPIDAGNWSLLAELAKSLGVAVPA